MAQGEGFFYCCVWISFTTQSLIFLGKNLKENSASSKLCQDNAERGRSRSFSCPCGTQVGSALSRDDTLTSVGTERWLAHSKTLTHIQLFDPAD